MIDTSGDYGTEPGIAEAVRRSSVPREELFIVTKVEEDENARESAERNVRELGLEYADLLLIHRPPPGGSSEDLWRGLMRAREDGVARDIGVSNYSANQIDSLAAATGDVPVVNQIEWSPFGHDADMLAYCDARKIIIQAYSPLTRGERLADPVVGGVAEAHGKTPAQILLRWNLELGTVPLPKANRQEHQAENLDIFDFELSDEEISELASLNERYSALGSLPYL
jgi:diketogulonate reductase-like aldo/keto reductase